MLPYLCLLVIFCYSCQNEGVFPVWFWLCYILITLLLLSGSAVFFARRLVFQKFWIMPSHPSRWAQPKSANFTTCPVPHALLLAHKAPVCQTLSSLFSPDTLAHVLAGVLALISYNALGNLVSIQIVFPCGKKGRSAPPWKRLLKSGMDTEVWGKFLCSWCCYNNAST